MTAKRVDASQPAIVAGWRAVGALVILTHTVGDDCPDAFVWFRRRWTAHELKSDNGRLTLGQHELQAHWPGAVYITRSVEEGLEQIGAVEYSTTATTDDHSLPPERPVRITARRKEQAR